MINKTIRQNKEIAYCVEAIKSLNPRLLKSSEVFTYAYEKVAQDLKLNATLVNWETIQKYDFKDNYSLEFSETRTVTISEFDYKTVLEAYSNLPEVKRPRFAYLTRLVLLYTRNALLLESNIKINQEKNHNIINIDGVSIIRSISDLLASEAVHDKKKLNEIISVLNTFHIFHANANQSVTLKRNPVLINTELIKHINNNKPDIFVLTEVFDINRQIPLLVNEFDDFHLIHARRPAVNNTNEILIGIKRSGLIKIPSAQVHVLKQAPGFPNYLEIEAKIANKTITIIGVRIATTPDRDKQLAKIIARCKHLSTPTIIIGDFNDHSIYTLPTWNCNTLSQEFSNIDFIKTTPNIGFSIGTEKLDHIISRGFKIDNCIYNEILTKNKKIEVCSNIPDHNFLEADIKIY